MFLKYIDFIFQPFRNAQNKWINVKQVKGNFMVDVDRSKALLNRGKNFGSEVGQFNNKLNGAGGAAQGAQMQGGAPGMADGAPNPNPPIRKQGFWIFKKHTCSQCEQRLDKTWDACPFCAQIAAQAAESSKKVGMKTQAFVLDATGHGSVQLLGWLVPLQGPQRGELFTLSASTSIGTDPKCTIILNDKFMSSKHAEINAENGTWILRDSGSTNGTYVNNKRVDRHELIDNDFIKFGSAMLKFKSL